MSWFALHPALTGLLLVTVLCLLSFAIGIRVGDANAKLNAILAELPPKPEPLGTDTAELRWADRPAAWL